MRILKLFPVLLLLSVSVKSQSIISFESTNKQNFLVGGSGKLITNHDSSIIDSVIAVSDKTHILFLEDDTVRYTPRKISLNKIEWTFNIPAKNSLVGKNRKLHFNFDEYGYYAENTNIYSEEPRIIEITPKILHKDDYDWQPITITLNNVYYVDKIEFEDENIKIAGTNINSIKSSDDRTFFNYNESNNTISLYIKFFGESNLNFKVFYTNQEFRQVETQYIKYEVGFKLKHENQSFQIITQPNYLYVDDFINAPEGVEPEIRFSFKNLGEVGKEYKISSSEESLVLKRNSSDQFEMPPEKEIEVNVESLLKEGKYKIYISDLETRQVFTSELNILPIPQIEEVFYVGDQIKDEFTLENSDNKKYSFKLKGKGLNSFSNVRIEMVNFENEDALYQLKVLPVHEVNAVTAVADFSVNSSSRIPIGRYYIRLSRDLITFNQKTIRKTYSFNGARFIVKHPKKPEDKQLENLILDDAKSIKKVPKKHRQLNLLEASSPMKLHIPPVNGNKIPQYLEVEAKYIKFDGSTHTKELTSSGYDFVYIDKNPEYFDLRRELNIENFRINEKVQISVRHSQKIYSQNGDFEDYVYHRAVNFIDRWGLTFSIPPYLAAFRKVRRKEIEENENGEKVAKYRGDKEVEYQNLFVNAGVGIKYIARNKDYKLSRLGGGLYIMGLDFGNKQSIQEQQLDPDNHNFIGRGSFNILALGEVSLLNLDSPNSTVPLYIGFMFIPEPIDGGPNWAPVFGFGIDIKIVK